MGIYRRIRRCGGIIHFLDMWSRNTVILKPIWGFLQRFPLTRGPLNSIYTCLGLKKFIKTMPRINKYTLANDYMSFESMYDESRTMYTRVLPRAKEYTAKLQRTDPNADKATNAFRRQFFIPETNANVSLLIGFYAQWFSHEFFNTSPQIKKSDGTWDYTPSSYTNQPVGFNLSQLYGSPYALMEEHHANQAGSLREINLREKKDGLMKVSQIINGGGDFPPIIQASGKIDLQQFPFWDSDKTDQYGNEAFQIPLALANMVPGFAGIHTLFLRHHNYIARELKETPEGSNWDDERLFQVAKIINMLTVLKVTMNDYVANALQTSNVKIKFDPFIKDSIFWKLLMPKSFPPINFITAEFNFLYRWHQFYPDNLRILKTLNGDINNNNHVNVLEFPVGDDMHLNSWNSVDFFKGNVKGWDIPDPENFKQDALERLLLSGAQTPAGQLTITNTQEWLANHVGRAGLLKQRSYEFASYNDYREYFGFKRVKSFEDINDDPRIVNALKAAYETVDDVEYYIGIFAEHKEFGGIHGPLIATIGVGFTYSGIFSTRLLERDIVNEKTLTKRGMELIENVGLIKDLAKLHTKLGENDLWKQINFRTPGHA